ARGAFDFYDVADGSTNLHYAAVAGYDEATGWGPFDGANLLGDLAGNGTSTPPGPSLSNPQVAPRNLPSSGGQVGVSGDVTSSAPLTNVTVSVTATGGSTTTTALSRSGNTNSYSATLNIPANRGTGAALYQLSFNATDANGKSGSLNGGSVNVAAS